MSELPCYNHPNRPTLLRCNQCERPICTSCAVHTPTGYRCRECVQQQQKKFDTAVWSDYLIVLIVTTFLSGMASLIMFLISSFLWGFIVFFVSPPAGILIADSTRWLVRGRRSRWMNLTFALSMILGALPLLLLTGLGGTLLFVLGAYVADMSVSLFGLGSLFWQIVYLVLAVPTAYSRFTGLVLGR